MKETYDSQANFYDDENDDVDIGLSWMIIMLWAYDKNMMMFVCLGFMTYQPL